MIDKQFSNTVAAAQSAKALDAIASNLLQELSKYSLPDALSNTGLRFSLDKESQIQVYAHGKSIYSSFDHVWLKDSLPFPRLGGRVRFWIQNKDIKDDSICYEVIFDSLGNARLGDEKYFGHAINSNNSEYKTTLQQISLGIVNGIHGKLDTVE